jgi:GT2 family glycosyltransferase
VDLGWRAQLRGWPCWYAPRAVVYHKLSATGGGVTHSYYNGRNFLWVLAKNLPSGLWRRHRGAILRAQWHITRQALAAWRGREARARLCGQLAGLLTWPRMLPQRRAIQAARRVSLDDLAALLTPPGENP